MGGGHRDLCKYVFNSTWLCINKILNIYTGPKNWNNIFWLAFLDKVSSVITEDAPQVWNIEIVVYIYSIKIKLEGSNTFSTKFESICKCVTSRLYTQSQSECLLLSVLASTYRLIKCIIKFILTFCHDIQMQIWISLQSWKLYP